MSTHEFQSFLEFFCYQWFLGSAAIDFVYCSLQDLQFKHLAQDGPQCFQDEKASGENHIPKASC